MSSLRALRLVTLLEGISLLVLLLVAMPLKYAAGLPLAVRIVGSLHGLLFVLFVIALYRVILEHRWPMRRWARVFVAALLPGGVFFLDRTMRE